MPIYEYLCSDCQHPFEALVFGGKTPDCPKCGSSKLEKRFSSFAVGSAGQGSLPPSCPAPSGGG